MGKQTVSLRPEDVHRQRDLPACVCIHLPKEQSKFLIKAPDEAWWWWGWVLVWGMGKGWPSLAKGKPRVCENNPNPLPLLHVLQLAWQSTAWNSAQLSIPDPHWMSLPLSSFSEPTKTFTLSGTAMHGQGVLSWLPLWPSVSRNRPWRFLARHAPLVI